MELLRDMGFYRDLQPIRMQQDNSSAVVIVETAVANWRSRHYRIKAKALQEARARNQLVLEQVPTDEMLADALTKAVGKEILARFRAYFFA